MIGPFTNRVHFDWIGVYCGMSPGKDRHCYADNEVFALVVFDVAIVAIPNGFLALHSVSRTRLEDSMPYLSAPTIGLGLRVFGQTLLTNLSNFLP